MFKHSCSDRAKHEVNLIQKVFIFKLKILAFYVWPILYMLYKIMIVLHWLVNL